MSVPARPPTRDVHYPTERALEASRQAGEARVILYGYAVMVFVSVASARYTMVVITALGFLLSWAILRQQRRIVNRARIELYATRKAMHDAQR